MTFFRVSIQLLHIAYIYAKAHDNHREGKFTYSWYPTIDLLLTYIYKPLQSSLERLF